MGRQFAGRQVLVEKREPGVWIIRTARVVPDSEQWLQHPSTLKQLEAALSWAMTHPAEVTDFDAFEKKMNEAD